MSPTLALEFTMEIMPDVATATWSLDDRLLVLAPGAHPTLEFVDVARRQKRDWAAPHPLRILNVAMSPDNQQIAIHQPVAGTNRLSLYSASDHREIGQLILPVENCTPGILSGRSLAFSRDGNALWLGCYPKTGSGLHPAAVKIRLPDFQVEDQIERTSISNDMIAIRENSISHQEGTTILTEIADTYTSDRQAVPGFIRAIDVNVRQDIFQITRIRTSPWPQVPTTLQYSLISKSNNLAIVFRKLAAARPAPGMPSSAFETYDTTTGVLVTEFWSADEQRDIDTGGLIANADIIPNTSYLVAAIDASANPQKHGGLILWNARTGSIAQRIAGASAQQIAVSHSGERVALIASRSLYIYSVNW